MVTMAKRIEQLRTERGLSRPALSAALDFPKQAMEKFETGRLTPTREQQEKMASFFDVSLFYFKGESNDRTRQDNWIDSGYLEEDEPRPSSPPPRRPARIEQSPEAMGQEQGGVFASLMSNKSFQDMIRATVLEVLRSPEGQQLLERSVRKELDRRP